MIDSFLTLLATMVGNKKVLGGWMVLLSLATAEIGSKVYVGRTAEIGDIKGNIAVVETKIDSLNKTLEKIDNQLLINAGKIDDLKNDVAEMRTELAVQRTDKNGKK